MTASAFDEKFLALRAGSNHREVDIYQLYAELRSAAPFWRSPWGDVYLSSYELVEQAFDSRAMSRTLRPTWPNGNGPEAAGSPIADWLIFQDGAAHARLRHAFLGPFAARDGSLVRRVTAIVDEQLSVVRLNCPIDAVAEFTRAIPEKIICEMMGMPLADMPLFRAWSEEIRATLDTGMDAVAVGMADAAAHFTDYFVDALKCQPRGHAAAGVFDVTELKDAVGLRAAAANLVFLAFSGHETTVHLLANMLWLLSKTPATWKIVRETPALAPAVVSEVLRLESPVQKICRWALSDIEFSGGHRLHKGENTVLLLGAANRDPDRFPDPDRIDLARSQTGHLAFGKGLHSCIGRGLAVMEGVAVLRWLTEHVRAVALETNGIEWIDNSSFRGLQRLLITLHG